VVSVRVIAQVYTKLTAEAIKGVPGEKLESFEAWKPGEKMQV
jgi:hypothetical protein